MPKAWVKDLYWIPKKELDMNKVNDNFVLELSNTEDELDLLYCYKEQKIKGVPYIGLPRGNPKLIRYCLYNSSYWNKIKDQQTDAPVKFNLQFNGEYRDYQKKAIKDMVKANNGVLKAMPRTGKCVTGKTIITTSTGFSRIQDLMVGPLIKKLDNDEQYYKTATPLKVPTLVGDRPVEAIYCCPNVNTYRVITDLGYVIQGTDDEKLLIGSQWVKISDLKRGQEVDLNIKTKEFPRCDNPHIVLNIRLYGYLSRLKRVSLYEWELNTSKVVINRILRLVDKLGYSYTLKQNKNLHIIFKEDKKNNKVVRKSYSKFHIPSWILNNTKLLPTYLGSLYEVHFYYNEPERWVLPNPSIALEIQSVLLNYGIVCKRINRKLFIYNLLKLYDFLEFKLKSHLQNHIHKSQPKVTTITNIIETKPLPVYDLVVGSTEEEHNFIANGFRVHNTVMGTGALAQLQQKTLILAHQTDLIEQFCNETINHPEGLLFNGASSKTPIAGICKTLKDFEKYPICLATYQSFISTGGMKLLDKIKDMFGVVLVDEVHRTPAERYSQVIAKFSARRMYGLTATDDRKDSKYKLAELMIGSVFHQVKAKSLSARVSGVLCKYPNTRKPKTWNGMMSFLFNNEKRNKRIALKALADVKRGHTVLIPVTQHAHALSIQKLINLYSGNNDLVFLFTGQIPKNKRQWARDQMNNNPKIKIVIAMRSMLTGLNVPKWSCIYTIVPISNEPNYTQEVFRVCTPMEGKKTPLIRFFFDTELGASYGCLRTCLKTLGKPENGFHFCKSFKRVLEYKGESAYRSEDNEGTYKSPHGSKRGMRF